MKARVSSADVLGDRRLCHHHIPTAESLYSGCVVMISEVERGRRRRCGGGLFVVGISVGL